VTSAYRTALKSFGRRYLELHDEFADLDAKIAALADDLAPDLIARPAIGYETAAQSLLKWSGKVGQPAKMYPTMTTGYTNDEETQFFGQV